MPHHAPYILCIKCVTSRAWYLSEDTLWLRQLSLQHFLAERLNVEEVMTVTRMSFVVACSTAPILHRGATDPCQFAEKSAKDSEKNDRFALPKRESVANCCYLAGPLSVASTFVIQTRCIYVLASAIQARCVPVMCYRGVEDAMSGYSSHSKCVCCELRRSRNRCKWLQRKIGFNWSGGYPSHLAVNSRSLGIMTTMWCLKVVRNLVCN